MKKLHDWLSTESSRAVLCSKLTTILWELNPMYMQKGNYAVQLYSLALLTIFLQANNPIWQNHQLRSFSAETCSEHTFFSDGDAQGTISLPKFDPDLGTLRGVEITTSCTVMADVEEKAIQGNNYSLGLSIALKTELPGQAVKTISYQSQFRRAVRLENTTSAFTANFSETKQKSTELITDHLPAFSGKGEVSIPLQVEGLVNFKNATSRISSNLKTKLCIKYLYD